LCSAYSFLALCYNARRLASLVVEKVGHRQMRISGWFLGIVGFLVLIVSTIACSVVTFSSTRGVVIGLWESGQQVEQVGDLFEAVLAPEDFTQDQATSIPTAQPNDGVVTIPSVTPQTMGSTSVAVEATAADTQSDAQALATDAPTAEPTVDSAALAASELGPREINILLMGIDQRLGYDTERAYRTDTMIVVHIDPVRRTAGVISFPRDLWVEIPEFNTNSRLNTANFIGDNNNYPGGGGPALAMETINANFGIRIDHYVMVNFTVVETVIDILAPDGIPVEVTEVIRDPDYPDEGYGIINVEFDPGVENMSGTRLLQYARTRATEGGDLDRARRQQQVLEAVRSYVLSAGGIQQFLTQIPALWEELSGSYRTDLTLQEIVGLGFLMNEIDRDDIQYRVIGTGYIIPDQNAEGDQILLPIHSEIQNLISETFYPGTTSSTADLRSLAEAENVTVRVFNGTQIAGLAASTREYLIGRGAVITDTGNAPNHNGQPTVIRYYNTGRDTALWLASLLGLTSDRVERGTDGLATDGVIVIAGPDIQSLLGGQ